MWSGLRLVFFLISPLEVTEHENPISDVPVLWNWPWLFVHCDCRLIYPTLRCAGSESLAFTSWLLIVYNKNEYFWEIQVHKIREQNIYCTNTKKMFLISSNWNTRAGIINSGYAAGRHNFCRHVLMFNIAGLYFRMLVTTINHALKYSPLENFIHDTPQSKIAHTCICMHSNQQMWTYYNM